MGVAEAGGGKPDALGRYIYLASLLWVLKMASNIVRCFKGSISRSKGRALWACFVGLLCGPRCKYFDPGSCWSDGEKFQSCVGELLVLGVI